MPTLHRHRSSVFYNPYRKRGLRSGYVKGTEILLGLLIHSFEGAEDLVSSVLHGKDQTSEVPRSLDSTPTVASSLLGTWRKSAALEHLQKALLVTQTDEDEESYIQNLDDTLTRTFNAQCQRANVAKRARIPEAPVHPQNPLLFDSTVRTAELLASSSQAVPCDGPTVQVATHPLPVLPSNWMLLIDVYLTYTHSWLPIIQKHTLLRTASLLSDNTNDGSHTKYPASGDVVSLWAALAYSAFRLETVQGSESTLPTERPAGELTSTQLLVVAHSLAMQDPPRLESGHVHAFLVLCLLDMSRGMWTKAWFWVGRAVYTATSLNIAPPLNHGTRQTVLNDTDRRLFLGCFILDTAVSLRLGYRPYFNSTDFQRVGGINLDGPEEWEPWQPIPTVLSDPSIGSSGRHSGRLLSALSYLGYLAGILNRLHQATSPPKSKSELHDLIGEFLQRQATMSKISTAASVLRDSGQGTLNVPPHVLHSRIAEATTYILIKTEIAKVCVGASKTGDDMMPSTVAETIHLLKSTPTHSPAVNPEWAPPTLSIFYHLIQQAGASSINNPLRADWLDHALASGHMTTLGLLSQQSLRTPHQDKVVDGTLAAPHPSHVSLLAPEDPLPSVRADTLTRGGEGAPEDPASADSEGLFNQLTVLDTADWQASSADFMEHLGLSRDGSFLDIDTLFS